MEPKFAQIINLISELTEKGSLGWKIVNPNDRRVLKTTLNNFEFILSFSGTNVRIDMRQDNQPVDAFAERANMGNKFKLLETFKTAQKQALGTDEKLESAIQELLRIRESNK